MDFSQLSDAELEAIVGGQHSPRPSKLESAARGAFDTATFGFGAKGAGALGALGARAIRPDLFEDESFNETYKKGRNSERRANALAAEENPKSYFGGSIAGAILGPGKGKAVNSIKSAAKQSGIFGAVYGLGTSDLEDEEGIIDSVAKYGRDTAAGGAFGAVTGAGLQYGLDKAVKPLYGAAKPYIDKYNPFASEKIVEELRPELKLSPRALKQAKESPFTKSNEAVPIGEEIGKTPQSLKALDLSKKFNVPISRGQATQSLLHQTEEDLLASGAKGAEAAAIVNAERESQREGFQNAAHKLRRDIGGGEYIERGVALKGATNKILKDAKADKKAITETYDLAKDTVGILDINDAKQFSNVARAKLAESTLTPDNAPATYNELKAYESIFSNLEEGTKGVDFKRIEGYRQGLSTAGRAAKGQDKRGIGILVNQLDEFLDNTIETALIHGDKKVLEQFKDARALNYKYMQNYTTKDKTDFGKKFIQDIVEHGENYTPAMVSKKLLGASKYGFKDEAVSIANELKKRLGENSAEYKGIQLETVSKVIKPLINVRGEINFNNPAIQTFKNNLYENKEALESLLSKDQFKELSDFGDLGSLLFQSRKSVTNPSQSGLVNTLAKLPFIKQVLGFASGIPEYPIIRSIPEAYNAHQAKAAFARPKVEKAVQQHIASEVPNIHSQLPQQGALVGSSLTDALGRSTEEPSEQIQTEESIQPEPTLPDFSQLSTEELERIIGQPQARATPELINKISQIESNNNPLAKAKGSTASGLYQFTNGTWKDAVNRYGDELGISLADKNNPVAQRAVTERMIEDNGRELSRFLGREAEETELYLTHFLGLEGAKKLLKSDGRQFAARILPAAAKSNRGVFFRNGKPLTVAELYQIIDRKVKSA